MRENIYIRMVNENRWKNITNKSAWVNAMLERTPPNAKAIKQHFEPEPMVSVNVCKVHGTPLTSQGKCLQKGCKYA